MSCPLCSHISGVLPITDEVIANACKRHQEVISTINLIKKNNPEAEITYGIYGDSK